MLKNKIKSVFLISALVLTNIVISNSEQTNIDLETNLKSTVDFEVVNIDKWYKSNTKYESSEYIAKQVENNGKDLLYLLKDRSIKSDKGNIILHNNGKPIDTNIFEDKQGNELFAISIENENGLERYTYHIADTDAIDIDNKVKDIISNEFLVNNNTKGNTGDGAFSESYKWDFFSTISGKKQQQGSLATSVLMTRDKSTSALSIWKVEESSQLLSRSNRSIKEHMVRMDVNQTNQILHDWGPQRMTNGDDLKVNLSGLQSAANWSFNIKGFGFVDLSRQGSKYARWKFVDSGIYPSRDLKVKPGIVVTNKKGSLFVKLSQTVSFSKSNHQTGIIPITESDFK